MEQFIQNITKKAGDAVLSKFKLVGVSYTKKDDHDVVTEADLLSNEILSDAIKEKYPSHGIISEEMDDYNPDAEYKWIIDPLDGTLNFSRHVPNFGVMTALSRNSEVELACIYLPALKEFAFAKKGEGALLNKKKIQCSNTEKWSKSVGLLPGSLSNVQKNRLWNSLFKKAGKNRIAFNAFYCMAVEAIYTASGRRDWKISIGKNDHVWDYAAPSLILREAGCVVTNKKGKDWTFKDGDFIASNPHLHKELISALAM